MMAQSRAESTRDTCNYGQYINQFPQNTIKAIREFERIQKKICRHKMSIMFNEICINEEMLPKYTYIYIFVAYDYVVFSLLFYNQSALISSPHFSSFSPSFLLILSFESIWCLFHVTIMVLICWWGMPTQSQFHTHISLYISWWLLIITWWISESMMEHSTSCIEGFSLTD